MYMILENLNKWGHQGTGAPGHQGKDKGIRRNLWLPTVSVFEDQNLKCLATEYNTALGPTKF